MVKKNFSYWTIMFAGWGTLFLLATYLLSPNEPSGFIVVFLKILLVLSILLLLVGVGTSVLAIQRKESGWKKYLGILLPLGIVLISILLPILMGIGFILNDQP